MQPSPRMKAMGWLGRLFGSPEESEEQPQHGRIDIRLPESWQAGLQPSVSREGRNEARDAIFAAHDPGHSTTLVVFEYEPADDVDQAIASQEEEYRTGSESDPSVDSFNLRRVSLPAGPALRFAVITDLAQVQYYVYTPPGTYGLWFTAPSAEVAAREGEFEEIARSFRLVEDGEGTLEGQ